MKNKFSGLSLSRDRHFVRNLVIAVGVVLVRRGVWHLADMYLLPNHPLASSIVSLIVGILILYLPDGTLEHLGWYKKDNDEDKK
jgi:Fuseless